MRVLARCLLATLPLLAPSCTAPDATAPTAPPAMSIPQVPCGASIVNDLWLQHHMVCPGNALVVNADGIRLDLDGYSITGSGTGNGISVRQRRNVTITGGLIANFASGIYVQLSDAITINENRLTQNREAVTFTGTSNSVISKNVIWENQLRGIMLMPMVGGGLSTANDVADNILSGNRSGIQIFGQPGNTIRANWITASAFAALNLAGGGASGNVFRDNMLEAGAAGVVFGAGWAGNDFIGNRFLRNHCALIGNASDNTFRENVFQSNDTISC